SSAVHNSTCADTRSPFHPVTLSLRFTSTWGLTDFGYRLSMLTKEACRPAGTADQSDSVSAVGSGSSFKVAVVWVDGPLLHAVMLMPTAVNMETNSVNVFGFIAK